MAGTTFKNLGSVNEAAAPGAGNAIVPAVIVKRNGILHITVVLDTATEVALKIDDGTTSHECTLNSGAAVIASDVNVWPMPVLSDYTYTLVIKTGSADSTIQTANLMLETAIG